MGFRNQPLGVEHGVVDLAREPLNHAPCATLIPPEGTFSHHGLHADRSQALVELLLRFDVCVAVTFVKSMSAISCDI